MRNNADKEESNTTGALLGIISVFLLFIAAAQSTYASEPNVVDNGDYTYTATWDFDDMTNYTLANLTASNSQVNLTISGYHWNQSTGQDFSEGQGSNVVGGDGVVVNPDDLVLGYLPNQNFTTPNNWVYVNSTDSKVISQWSPSENGWLYSSHLKNTTIEMTIMQPNAVNGIDAFINESDGWANYGNNESLIIGKSTNEQRTILWFDISSILDTNVLDAKLELYFYKSNETTSTDISVHRITSSWAEMSTNWQECDAITPWLSSGGDFDPLALDTVTGLTDNFGWKSWNITTLVDGWVNGTYENYGLLLYIPAGTPGEKRFYSSDYATASFRPKLNITYDPLDTYNETAYISYEFPLLDEGAYIDFSVSDFELGVYSNISISPGNGGEIILDSTGYLKFDTLDNVTDWEEDPDTKKGSGTFVLSNTIFCEGTGSMRLDYDLASTQQNYGVMRTAATFWDWSSFTRLDVWARSSWQGEVMKVIIEDTNTVSWKSNPVSPANSWAKYSFDLSSFPGDISSIYALKFHLSDTTLATTTYLDNITLLGGSPYFPEGLFESRIIDAGYKVPWNLICWEEDKPVGTDIEIRTRTGNTSTPDGSWSGWSSPYIIKNGSDITSPEGRYLQYRVYLNTTDPDYTPSISEVTLVKLEYNLTFYYSIDAFSNITWANIFMKLDGEILWEKIVNQTILGETVYFDIGRHLTGVGNKSVEFGLTVNANSTNGVNISAIIDDFQIKGPTGFYISKIYDAGSETNWENVTWNADFTLNTNLTLTTRSSIDNITWSPWSNPLQFNKDNITSPDGRYFQYRINFTTQILGTTPVFKWINTTHNKYYYQGTLTFNNDLVVGNVTDWGIFTADSILQGQTITYEYSIDSGNNWYQVPIDGNLSFVSTSTNKIRFKAIFEAQNTSMTPTLNSISLTYFVNRPPQIVGVVPDQNWPEDGGPWTLDLTPYESDHEDSGEDLRWYITGENTSLYTVDGEYSNDDIITFTPLPNLSGTDQVQLWLQDSSGAKTSQLLWINITPDNDPPSIIGLIPSFEKNEDSINWNYDLSPFKYDIDNTSAELFWQVVGWDAAIFDSVTVVGDVITFDLASNANGNDEMTIILSDGLLTDTQNIWVNVTSMNDAPIIMGIIPDFDKSEDDLNWILDLTAYESDVEDSSPSASLTWGVANVDSNLLSITISDNNLTFSLKSDAYGNNEITIILTDSLGTTDSQNIWVNVTSENDAPAISSTIPGFDKEEDAENWEISLLPYKFDIDNASSELYWSVSGWSTGLFDSVSVTGDTLTFDLNANAFGNDEITINLSDGALYDTQNIWVNVTPANDAPEIVTTIPDIQKAEDSPNWTLDLTSYENDIEDGSPSSSLAWSISNINTSLLSILISDNNITFSLIENAYGYDQITFTLTDSGGKTAFQNVFVEIISVNDAPVIQPTVSNIVTNEDKNTSINLLTYGSDIEDSQGQLRWWLDDVDNTLYSWYLDTLTNTLYIDPLSNAYGTDDATLILTDSDGSSTSQPIQIVIVSVNDAPYISPQIPQSYFEALEDQPITVILTGFENDVEDSNALLTWSVEGVNTSVMKVSIDIGLDEVVIVPIVEFLPEQTENVESGITLILTDSDGLEDRQDIIVIFCPINNAPVIGDLPHVMVKYDEPYVIDLLPYVFDEDTPEGQLVITTSEPSEDQGSGYLSVTGLNLTFHYPQIRVGDTFIIVVMVSDDQFTSYATMQVEISDNSPPQLLNPLPSVNFDEDTNVTGAFDLDDYFTDPEGGSLNFSFYLQYMHHGDEFIFVTIKNDNAVGFSAVDDWYGQEQITFRAEDAQGAIVEGTIAVTVNPVNDAPVIFGLPNQVCKINESKVLGIQPFISDVDDPFSDLTISTNSLYINVLGHELTFLYDEAITENVVIIVSDGSLENSVTIEVTASSNIPPSFSIIPELVVKGGEVYLFSFKPYVSDIDNPQADLHIWTNSIYTNPNAVDNMLLEIDFPVDMIGEDVVVTVFISDGLNVNSTGMLIHITNESIPELVRSLPNIFLDEDSVLLHALYLNDYFQNTADYQFFGNDKINITIDNGWLSLSSSGNWSGTETITIRGVQGIAFVEDTIEVTIRPVNDPPVLSPFPSFNKTLNEIWTLNLIGYIHDIDTPITDLIINVDSPHVIIYSFNLYFQYQYEINEIITVTVIDGESSVSGGIYVNVTAENNPPTYVGLLSNFQIKPGETWSIDLDDFFYDMDGDDLTFSCNKAEIYINPVTHVATWTPPEDDGILKDVIFSATDGYVTIESSAIDLVLDIQGHEPSFWETNWWLILAIFAIVTSVILAFVMMKRKEHEEEEIEYDVEVDKAIEFLTTGGGGAFTIKSNGPEKSYEVFSGLLQAGFDGMCITTKQPEALMQQYNLGKAWIIKLTLRGKKDSEGDDEETKMVGLLALGDEAGEGEKYIFSSNFNRIVETIEDFLMAGDNKVVLLDGLEYILGGDELIMYVGFIASIKERLKDRKSCLLLPIDPKTLSEKESRLLERETMELGKILQESAKGMYEVPSHLVPEADEMAEVEESSSSTSDDIDDF